MHEFASTPRPDNLPPDGSHPQAVPATSGSRASTRIDSSGNPVRRPIRRVMQREEWLAAMQQHEQRFKAVVSPHVERRSRHVKDPVADFLFEYYRFRPSHLRKWHPGTAVELVDAHPDLFEDKDGYQDTDSGRILLPESPLVDERFRKGTAWIHSLLTATQDRPARLGCFGLHEWAMLYRAGSKRHDEVPLRIREEVLEEVVESTGLRCTHFDAFRFFTDKARPLNPLQLSRTDMHEHEQPGCLHANMDVYRWAFKRVPWIPSELVLSAFELALEIRTLDMASSPYDLRQYGLDPVPVETRSGRERFTRQQQHFSERAKLLRAALIQEYEVLVNWPT